MEPRKLIDAMAVAERLKNNTRHSYTTTGRKESVAEHSWRLILLAYFVSDEFKDIDLEKLMKMCLIHDLGEAFTGDIPSFLKNYDDEERENRLLAEWVSSLPSPFCNEMNDLYNEMNALRTKEACIYKALDNMEAVIQHNEADISTWIPLEYELNLTYGEDKAEFSPYLKGLRALLRDDSIRKISDAKNDNYKSGG